MVKEEHLPLDWNRMVWVGNPNNQRIVAKYTLNEFCVTLSVQDFRCPRFAKHPRFGQAHPFMALSLGDELETKLFIFDSAPTFTDKDRERFEHNYWNAVFAAGRVIGHRPKESEKFLRKLLGLPRGY
jgi:hypothetical protein